MENFSRLENVIKQLIKNDLSIAVAESCTGGFVSNMFTNIPGASKIFERGIVCYSNEAKISILNVDPKTLDEFGAVSDEVARQLAFNLRILSNVDISIGTTGIAGPTGGTNEKPIGLVFVSFSTEEETSVKQYNFQANRLEFKEKVFNEILEWLENYLDLK
ncbi:MAG: CinA family protein [Candidatus Lokiarchaeota archaeon]|nr:CinA family protein [Candidatus Lokiarchaeota archaeon]